MEQRRIPRIYIAGRFRGPDNASIDWNIQVAAAFRAPIARLGGYPVCVHIAEGLAMHDIQQENNGQFWLEATMVELKTCDAVVVVPGFETSSGTRAEIKTAMLMNMPVFYADFEMTDDGYPEVSSPATWANARGTSNFADWIQHWRSFNEQA